METSSLDKSLQKKSLMEDMGQGEGGVVVGSIDSEATAMECCSSSKQKTEKNVGDGGGGGVVKDGCGTVGASATSSVCAASITKPKSPDKNSSSTSTSETTVDVCLTATNSLVSHTQPTSAFDTKVKQISQNLKETSIEDGTTSSSSSSSSFTINTTTATSFSSSSTPSESEHDSSVVMMEHNNSIMSAADAIAAVSAVESSSTASTNDTSFDDADNRSKKVRFHPDVKENDGGKRVIPKKKKKLKANAFDDEVDADRPINSGADDDMDLDDDDDFDDEEDSDLTKTIAEARNYLKTHPLTFVRPQDKSTGRLQNGLLEEEDLPLLSESSEDEDFYESQPTENGVERILGKQVKSGKVEFLLRYVDRPGLFWETEELIWKICPNLINLYEHNRERRQEHLMRHVAKRQNLRQRYTDF